MNPIFEYCLTQRRWGRGDRELVKIHDITGEIIEVAIEIHRKLGPGLLETVYRKVLAFELRKRGFDVEEEWPIPVKWDSIHLDIGFRADLVVNQVVLVELKSLEKIAAVHKKVLLTYLRIADKQVGLLINFGEEVLKSGIHRVVNNYNEETDGIVGGEQVLTL